jgi:hypothetical protein
MMTWLKACGLSVVALLAPVRPLLIAALALTLIDAVTGVLAARKRGERIRSAGLRRTVSKVLVYTLAIIAGFIVEKWLLTDLVAISKLAAGAIGLVEAKSIFENLDAVNGSPIFRTIVAKLGSPNDKPGEKGG